MKKLYFSEKNEFTKKVFFLEEKNYENFSYNLK